MNTGLHFAPHFSQLLPDTHALLRAANLQIHPAVARIVLHGSRGLGGSPRPDSDIDLSLLVDLDQRAPADPLEAWLHSIFEVTFHTWQGVIAVDLAVIFEARPCGLACFTQTAWQAGLCSDGGLDCFGLYKVQKGFHGLVTNAGIEVRRMYPCLEIWRRAAPGHV